MIRATYKIFSRAISFIIFIWGIKTSCWITHHYQLLFFYCVLIPYDIIKSSEVKGHYRFAPNSFFWAIYYNETSSFLIPSIFSILFTIIFVFPFACSIIFAVAEFTKDWNAYKFVYNTFVHLLLPDGLIIATIAAFTVLMNIYFLGIIECIPGPTIFKTLPETEVTFFSDKKYVLFERMILKVSDFTRDIASNEKKGLRSSLTFWMESSQINCVAVLSDNLKINAIYLCCTTSLILVSIGLFISLLWKTYKAYCWINEWSAKKNEVVDFKFDNEIKSDKDFGFDFKNHENCEHNDEKKDTLALNLAN